MLAEDNPSDVLIVREALAYHNVDATLTCHRDGEVMIRYIDRMDQGEVPCPDVILLDLNLPRHDGQAVLARIRRSPVCGQVPVIIVTSSKASADYNEILRLGATSYFHKSIDYDESMRLGALVLDIASRRKSM